MASLFICLSSFISDKSKSRSVVRSVFSTDLMITMMILCCYFVFQNIDMSKLSDEEKWRFLTFQFMDLCSRQ